MNYLYRKGKGKLKSFVTLNTGSKKGLLSGKPDLLKLNPV